MEDDEMDKKAEERAKRSKEPLEGLQHEIQQSRPAVEAGANGEKIGERGGGAVVNGGNGDTPFINKGSDSPSASAQEEQ